MGRSAGPSSVVGAEHLVVFVGGLHRSGTTLLARCLALHPDVSGFSGTEAKEDEGQHLQDVYPPARTYGGAGRFASDPRAHLTESSELVSEANGERLLRQWSARWDLDRRVLVEKSPPNVVQTRFLQALVPGCRFLVSIRHPLVVSLATGKWRRSMSLDDLLGHWFTAHELFLADRPSLTAAKVLKYEHLCGDPKAALADVARFLDLDGEVPSVAVRVDRSSVYDEQWSAMARSVLPWRRGERRRLIARYEERARAFGYSLEDLSVAAAFPAPASDTGTVPGPVPEAVPEAVPDPREARA